MRTTTTPPSTQTGADELAGAAVIGRPIGQGSADSSVDHRTLVARLLHAIADSTSKYLAFAIDGNGTCRVLECNGDVHVLFPDGEGWYDLAPLGGTVH